MLVELFELHPIEVLCEHIGGIVSSRNENDRDFVVLNAFTYIVIGISICLVRFSCTGLEPMNRLP